MTERPTSCILTRVHRMRSKSRRNSDDEVVARLNPETGAVENLEVLFFSTRLLRSELFKLPVMAELWLASQDSA